MSMAAKKKASRKSNAGRPTKYTPAKGDKICEMVAEGESASSACKAVGIPLRTMYSWLRANEDFRNNYEISREDAADTLVDDLMRIADTEEDVQRAKLKIDARKWVAARMKPKSWGDKLQVDQTTRIEDHSAEEIKEALQQKLKALQAQGIDVGSLLK